MNKIIIYLTIFLSFVSASALNAQKESPKHEFSIWGAGGLSTLKYNPAIGSQKQGLGGQFGLGYTYFLTSQWGIITGTELAFYNAKTKLNGFSGNYDIKDYEGEMFNFRYKVNQFEDKQTAMFVNIPLMVQFQTNGENKFFVALGGKIGIPISEKTKISKYNFQTSGYYAHENYEYIDEPYMGFGTFKGKKNKKDLNFKTSYMLSAELGVKWKVGERNNLYTGAYFDYGLNDINKTVVNKEYFLAYNTQKPSDYEINSIFNTKQNNNRIVKKVNPLATGIKVRFSFGIGSAKKRIEEEVVVQSIPPIVEPMKEEPKQVEKKEEPQREATKEPIIKKEVKKDLEDLHLLISGFAVNVTQLNIKQKQELDAKISILKKHTDWNIVLTGYTCDLGSQTINDRIAQQRAESVKTYLVSKGVNASRISLSGRGKQDYVTPNSTEESRRLNRRVVIRAEE